MAQFIDFGNGKEGNLTISASNLGGVGGFGVATFTGTAGNNYGTFSDVGYFNGSNGGRIGDLCIIHQSQNSGAGNWEIVRITNRSGTTVYFDRNLVNTYVSGAQIQSAPNLYNGTISGTLNPYSSWAGASGGIIFIVDKGTLTISGSINATGFGFRGGYASGQQGYGQTGESYLGSQTQTGSNNYSGGGGGKANSSSSSYVAGSPGANGGVGAGSVVGAGSYSVGTYGQVSGNATLTSMVFGGGSGGGGGDQNGPFGAGVKGGGIIVLIAKKIVITGSILCRGANGTSGYYTGGSGGGGGSVILICQNATLGTNLINATGGDAGTDGSHYGSAGGTGRVCVRHSGLISGSSSPSFNDTQDTSLTSSIYGLMY